ncbi:MAG: DUF6515 family protein [Desulfobacterales bacterium]|nr:DUF6515 family protein [Desulfobacterales bacterium]MDD4071768.1 DUF6515 family protein [Desulfobacterales bacterium]MDD4394259.1 DUF6515 family protein [Desulfobacterales bacterium]
MTNRFFRTFVSTVVIMLFLPAFAIMDWTPPAHAFRDPPGNHRPEKIVKRLPPRSKSVQVKGNRYYYHGKDFYQKRPSGYLMVTAPIGALVLSIPLGSRAMIAGGITFYVNGSTYYRRDPGGYLVVPPPEQPVIIQDIPPVVPSQQHIGGDISVTVSILNVRSGPGMNFPLINEVRMGDRLSVNGYAPDWLYVTLPDGQSGWVMLKFTSMMSTPGDG